MKDNKWYLEEVVKLLAIMKQDFGDEFVAKSYVIEKLERIINEIGIGIHHSLKLYVEKAMEKLENK